MNQPTNFISGGPTPAMPYSRMFELLPRYILPAGSPEVLAAKVKGQWQPISAQSFAEQVNAVSLGLMQAGIGKGDRVAIVSANRPEWNIVDFGIQQLGAVSVPLYPTITPEDYRYIFRDAGVKMAFTGNVDLFHKVRTATAEDATMQAIYCFDEQPGLPHWSAVKQAAAGLDQALLEPRKAAVGPDDLLTLIYTSGTTGEPKGVMLTHRNLISNVEAMTNYLVLRPGDKALSFLPMCHIFERTVLYMYLRKNISIFYAESMDTIADNLREIQPQGFTTVPRLLEKVYDRIVAKGQELTGAKRKLFFWALELGLQYDPCRPMGAWYNARLALARKLIFSKWQQALGGNVKMIVSGSAALQPRLVRVFWAAGIPVSQGYGLTETSPVISVCRIDPPYFEVGSVGEAIPGVEVKIAEDGEILSRGPHIMKGYFNKPDKTAEAIDADGWFHTGDIGEIVQGKFLKITDRKKEIFKTSGGKYVAPQVIENRLKESPLIEQVIVVGDGHKFPSALIVPEYQALRAYLKEKGIEVKDNTEAIAHPEAIDKISQEVEKTNAGLAQYERIKRPRLLEEAFSIDAGELTPTLKLKRKAILEKHKALINDIYK